MYPYALVEMIPNFAFALAADASAIGERSVPHLRADLPNFDVFDFEIGYDEELCLITIRFRSSGIPAGGSMGAERFGRLKGLVGSARTYVELRTIAALNDQFSADGHMIALDVREANVDWYFAQQEQVAWLNDMPLARAMDLNAARIRAVVPTPPQFSQVGVRSAMWILECTATNVQGTAFDLQAYGTVTNAHVVGGASQLFAFRAADVTTRYPVRVLRSHEIVDLAIIEIQGAPIDASLPIDLLEQGAGAHIAVCGFPNYRLGDTGVVAPGVVVGTRQRSGIRRLMTNATIVAGMSGGPVLGQTGGVVGICVTGSRFFQQAQETEDHSIVPVAALDFLTSSS